MTDEQRCLASATPGAGEPCDETNAGVQLLDFLDALPFYVMLVDADHRIRLINQAVSRDFGLPSEQITGGYCPQVIHGLDRPFPGCPLEEAVQTGQAAERELFDPATGRWILSAVYPTGCRTGEGRAMFAHLVYDITEKKRAEEANQHHSDTQAVINALLRLSLEDLPLAELLQRALDLILSVSWLAFESQGGIFLAEDSSETLVMKAQNGLAAPLQEACARVPFGRCLCGRAALTQEIQFADCLDERHETRYEGIAPHGHYCVPIRFASHVLGVINVYTRAGHRRDEKEEEFLTAIANTLAGIIQRRKVEEEKGKLQAQLFQAQKMEAIGTLAGGVAHDFNNLLTVIQGHAELAMMGLDENAPAYHDLREVRRAGARAAELTRQLLIFSRRQPTQLTPLNVNRTVDDLLKMLKRLIGADITIHADLALELWAVQADAGNIEQVVMNLVINARDALCPGGTITIRTENVTLDEARSRRIPHARPGRFVCLSVADTGIGMDQETLSHIFEPFFTTKEVGKGTGLGLSVVYGIVQQHQGWINVHSQPGQGATFKVYLPASAPQPADEGQEAMAQPALQGRGERILLVEDEDGVRRFAARVLGENGYVVVETANAEEAADVFEKVGGAFHLVFSDVVLPRQNGLQLVEELLSRKPDLHVLLSSGYTDQRSHWPAIRASGIRFLQKPYTALDLLQAVKEAIATGATVTES